MALSRLYRKNEMKTANRRFNQVGFPRPQISNPSIPFTQKEHRSPWVAILFGAFLALANTLQSDTVVKDGVILTSMVRLLAHPEKYHAKKVEVKVDYVTGQDFRAIFMTSEDAHHGNTQAAIWIDFNAAKTNKLVDTRIRSGWVEVIGTFHHIPGEGAGHMGMWPAELRSVTFFQRCK